MRHLICLFGSLVMALGLTVPASAATFNYDFTIFGASGVISFDDVTDGSRTSTQLLVVDNNILATGNAIYDPEPNPTPSFTFSGGNIVDAIGVFSFTVGSLDWLLEFRGANDSGIATTFSCADRDVSFGCGGEGPSGLSLINDLNATTQFSHQLTPIPLPAGLPLLITGLAAFAGLRMRKKRAAQV